MGGKTSKGTVTAECDGLMAPMEQRDRLEAQAHSFPTSTKNTLNIAFTGESGAGKSSLVNALRGMKTDEGPGAATTDVVQCTMGAKAYVHPTHPEITFWDLPGSGTPEFKAKKYIKDMKLNQYDFFIIVSKERFTEADAQLASAIHKMNKKIFYVRTKLDVDLENERKRPNFSQEETLEKIRKEYLKEVKRESSPKLFLISRWDLEKYDFPALEQALWDECDNLKRRASKLPLGGRARSTKPLGGGYLLDAISSKNLSFGLEKMKSALQEKDILAISAESREVLDLLEKTTLNIAVTGRAGAGKSSFVNALRGMTDDEEDSADTGVTQTTMDAKGYKHPLFPNVMLWDLPGIGTPEFKAAEYLKKVDFEKYDCFIIIASGRFT
ncbi:T-cell-specific guanine nucleotide triphosphate-binding protein 2-like, partial [Varanus komodoensis]|uniref:T-cell-specific guanine nucleotide triphosphate-binding protein 2-like n=1 Tax=Varanus komodoensis TaxID=61221 RepID=UPI001CF7C356